MLACIRRNGTPMASFQLILSDVMRGFMHAPDTASIDALSTLLWTVLESIPKNKFIRLMECPHKVQYLIAAINCD